MKNFLKLIFLFQDMFLTILNRFQQKTKFRKIFDFWSFLPFFGPFFKFLWEKFLIFSLFSKGLYCSHFALLHAFLRLSSSSGSLNLSNFWPKWPKIKGFLKIQVKNVFFEKNFFFENFFYQNILK